MRTRSVIGVVLLACATACGSTVSGMGVGAAGTSAATGDLGVGAGQDSSTGPTSTTTSSGFANSSSDPTQSAASSPIDETSTSAPTGPGVGAGGSAAAGKLPAASKGVNDTVVKLGFLYLASAGTVMGGIGVQGYSQGDELGEITALVADQNAHGGLGGRKIQVVKRDLGGIEQSNYQAACDYFTQDSPVFMVLTSLGHYDVLNDCLAKRGVGFTSDYLPPFDRLMRKLGPIYAPDDLSGERTAALVPRALIESGLFPKDAKVGIIRQDTPDYERATKNTVRPILEAAGIKVVAEETYSATDASGSASAAAAITFRLRGAGVTHVLTFESPLFYMTAAQSQGWHPFWSVTSRSGPGAFLVGSAPREQVANSGGPGWQPVSDLATAQQKGFLNPEERRCITTLAKAGYSYSGTPRYVEQMLCGELYHLVRVVARSTELSTRAFQVAAEALPSYPSPVTFSMSFAGGRHDGASGYRIVRYLTSCSCYQYTTPVRPIPSR